VRLTRGGYHWAKRYPRIVEAARKIRQQHFVIDGEAVAGCSVSNGLHSRRHDDEVQFYAFDMLAEGGEDFRKLPLSVRKASLARLLTRRVDAMRM
jgi:ATP-dependent DNA ligase